MENLQPCVRRSRLGSLSYCGMSPGLKSGFGVREPITTLNPAQARMERRV